MGEFIDLTGKRFGKWVVVSLHSKARRNPCRPTFWICQCDCGTIRKVRYFDLVDGRSKDCGCGRKKKMYKHGMSYSRLYAIWEGILSRCYYENNSAYKNYGGRGISVCKRWKTAKRFIDDMYESYYRHVRKYGEDNTQIDRIDVDGNYSPKNCRWVTRRENLMNKRPNEYKKKYGLLQYEIMKRLRCSHRETIVQMHKNGQLEYLLKEVHNVA